MKKEPYPETDAGHLLPHYDFDYSKAKPNRFADAANAVQTTIVLEPDLARIFKTSEAVNKALRAIVEAFPSQTMEELVPR